MKPVRGWTVVGARNIVQTAQRAQLVTTPHIYERKEDAPQIPGCRIARVELREVGAVESKEVTRRRLSAIIRRLVMLELELDRLIGNPRPTRKDQTRERRRR